MLDARVKGPLSAMFVNDGPQLGRARNRKNNVFNPTFWMVQRGHGYFDKQTFLAVHRTDISCYALNNFAT